MKPDLAGGANAYFAEFSRLLGRVEVTTREGASVPVDQGIDSVVEVIVTLKSGGGKALLIGNGGSAAIVSHVHNDLCHTVGVRAIVFNETPLLTAVANDHRTSSIGRSPWADQRHPGCRQQFRRIPQHREGGDARQGEGAAGW